MFEEKFSKMLNEHTEMVYDTRKFKGLLSDYFPKRDWKKNLILELYQLGIVEEIDKMNQIDILSFHRFKKELEEIYGTQRENAEWAVNTWIECYGKKVLKKTIHFPDDNNSKQKEEDNQENLENTLMEKMNTLLEKNTVVAPSEIKDGLLILKKAHCFRKVFNHLYDICILLKESGIEEEFISQIIEIRMFDSENVCSYDDYFKLFNRLFRESWKIDYYSYGLVYTQKGLLKNDSKQKGWQWIAYFREKMIEKKIPFFKSSVITYSVNSVNFNLGVMYASGVYVEKDMRKAKDCLTLVYDEIEKFENTDEARRIVRTMGLLYIGEEITVTVEKENEFSFKIRKNMKRGVEFLTKAVEYGDAEAMYYLGTIYEKGYPVQKDIRYAVELYMEAAEKGCEEASQWLSEHKDIVDNI